MSEGDTAPGLIRPETSLTQTKPTIKSLRNRRQPRSQQSSLLTTRQPGLTVTTPIITRTNKSKHPIFVYKRQHTTPNTSLGTQKLSSAPHRGVPKPNAELTATINTPMVNYLIQSLDSLSNCWLLTTVWMHSGKITTTLPI
jgi:hypothetical protein